MAGKLVALCGKKRSGKDEAARALVEDGWLHFKFADPLRECLLALDLKVMVMGCYVRLNPYLESDYEWAKDNIPDVRDLLKKLGTEVGRDILGPDTWTEMMGRRLDEALNAEYDVVISDARFDNEAELVKNFGGRVVLVDRPSLSGLIDTHRSESGIDPNLIDVRISNVGTIEELHEAIRKVANA